MVLLGAGQGKSMFAESGLPPVAVDALNLARGTDVSPLDRSQLRLKCFIMTQINSHSCILFYGGDE